MIISARVSDEVAAEIDRIAVAQGQTRAAWLALVIAREVVMPENDNLPFTTVQSQGNPDD